MEESPTLFALSATSHAAVHPIRDLPRSLATRSVGKWVGNTNTPELLRYTELAVHAAEYCICNEQSHPQVHRVVTARTLEVDDLSSFDKNLNIHRDEMTALEQSRQSMFSRFVLTRGQMPSRVAVASADPASKAISVTEAIASAVDRTTVAQSGPSSSVKIFN